MTRRRSAISSALSAILLFAGYGTCAAAQTGNPTTPVVGTRMQMGGVNIQTGSVTITPVGPTGAAIGVGTTDGAYNAGDPRGFQASITAGVIAAGYTVPDQCTATADRANTPIAYQVTVSRAQIPAVVAPGQAPTVPAAQYTYVIPASSSTRICGAAAFALDGYRPTQTPIVAPTSFGSSLVGNVPTRCTGSAWWYTYTVANVPADQFECIANAFVLVPKATGTGGTATFAAAAPWVTNTAYAAGTVVTSFGSTFAAPSGGLVASSTAPTSAAPGSWILLAAAGAQGTPGTPGVPGQGYLNRGAWAANTAYAAYDVFTSGGSTYEVSVPFTSGSTFDATKANLWASKGADGTSSTGGNSAPTPWMFANFPTNLPANTLIYQTDWIAGSVCTAGSGTPAANGVYKFCRALGGSSGFVPANALEKNLANGVAGLGADGTVQPAQMNYVNVEATLSTDPRPTVTTYGPGDGSAIPTPGTGKQAIALNPATGQLSKFYPDGTKKILPITFTGDNCITVTPTGDTVALTFNSSCASSSSSSTATATAPTNGLIYSWPMNEGSGTTFNETVSSNNSTASGITWTTDATLGNVPAFAGGTAVATSANNANANFNLNQPFSLSAWIKPTSVSSGNQSIIGNISSAPVGYRFYLNANAGLVFQIFNSSSGSAFFHCESASNVVTTALSNVIAVWNGSNAIAAYVNGAAISFLSCHNSLDTSSTANTEKIKMGNTSADNTDAFTGVIARTRIYNRSLTSAEAATIYQAKQ